MKRFLNFCFYFILICCVFVSCRKIDRNIHLIPKNAIGVFSLNTKSIEKKLTWSLLGDFGILQDVFSNEDVHKIEDIGIDRNSNIYAFGLPEKRIKSNFKFLLLLPLKNESKFENFLKYNFQYAEFKTINNLDFAIIDDFSVVGWNGKSAIIAYSTPDFFYDKEKAEKTRDILIEEIQNAFKLPTEQSLADNKFFRKFTKEQHDFSFFFNYESTAKMMYENDISATSLILASQKKLYENTYLIGGMNFKKGKIEIDAKYYYNSSIKAVAESFMPNSYNNDLLEKIPGEKLNFLTNLHLNSKGISTLIDTMGMLPITKMFLRENNLTADSILHLFSGDILFTMVDFNLEDLYKTKFESLKGTSLNPFVQIALSLNINNPEQFKEIIKLASNYDLIETQSDSIYKWKNYYFGVQDNYVVFSPFKETVKRLKSNTQTKNWNIPNEVRKNPFGLYADIKNTVDPAVEAYNARELEKEYWRFIDNIQMYGGKVKSDHSPIHLEINLRNKDENSLIQLLKLSQKLE